MIIAYIRNSHFRNMYINLIKSEIRKQVKTYSRNIQNIINAYSLKLIDQAIDSIYLVGNSIFCPTSGLNGQILRSLEYGTNNTKAYHIITHATKSIIKEVDTSEYVI